MPSKLGTQSRARAVVAVLATSAALGAAASPVSADTPKWGYEQLSPPGGSSIDVFANQVSADFNTMLASTAGIQLDGMPSDGRSRLYSYVLPKGGSPWAVGPFDASAGVQFLGYYTEGLSADGSWALRTGSFPKISTSTNTFRLGAGGRLEEMTKGFGPGVKVPDANLDSVAFLANGAPSAVYIGRPNQTPVRVSVDNDGNPMTATGLGGAEVGGYQGSPNYLAGNAYTADGSSVIFTSRDEFPGDHDIDHAEDPHGEGIFIGFKDIFRRVLTPGHEETYSITDANGDGDDDAGAHALFHWATADQSRVFFSTKESLAPGDTDGETDVYMRDGKNPPVWISQGETVDGSPTGNGPTPFGYIAAPQWVMSSEDGNRTFFASEERLTPDASDDWFVKLYERDVAEGRTRFVAGLDLEDLRTGHSKQPERGSMFADIQTDQLNVNFRGIRITPKGAVFMSKSPLLPDAFEPDGIARTKIFSWTRDGGLERVVKPDADAPPSKAEFETFLPYPFPLAAAAPEYNPLSGGRTMTADSSQLFFSTDQALTAEDTDGSYRDVYVWSQAEGIRLVSPPGSAPYNANYVENSPDGSTVWFQTSESILPSDTDPNAVDIYKATLGGGSPPSPQVPDADPRICEGAACQGPTTSVTPPGIGSVSFTGPGNVLMTPQAITSSVSVSKVKAVTGSAATLKVRVPSAGQISVSGASLRAAEKSAAKAGSYSVKVALTARGKRTLQKKKTVKVQVRVAYRPSDGPAAAKSVSVTFKQPKAKKTAASKKGGR